MNPTGQDIQVDLGLGLRGSFEQPIQKEERPISSSTGLGQDEEH